MNEDSICTCDSCDAFLGRQNYKERELKLSLELDRRNGIPVVHCRGRITYLYEAAALADHVSETLRRERFLVFDLSDVEAVDSAGLGELVAILTLARTTGCSIRLANPRPRVRQLLDITKLSSVFEIHPTLDDALLATQRPIA